MYYWMHFNKHDRRFFEADTGGSSGGAAQAAEGNGGAAKADEPAPAKTFTQEEVNAMLAKETAKLEKKAESKLLAIQEAEKLKGMLEAERAAAEAEKYKQLVADYEKKELVSQFKLELAGKGLPGDFAEHIPVSDAEKAKAAVDFLSKYKADIEKPLADKVKQLEEELKNANLRGTPPKAPGGTAAAKPIPHIF